MQLKTSIVPIFTIECPLCGNEYLCVGSEVVDVTTCKCRTYKCSCGYKAPFQSWPSEVYNNLIVRFNEFGDISVDTEEEL